MQGSSGQNKETQKSVFEGTPECRVQQDDEGGRGRFNTSEDGGDHTNATFRGKCLCICTRGKANLEFQGDNQTGGREEESKRLLHRETSYSWID